MKKFLLLIAICISTGAIAQDEEGTLVSKNGHAVLPVGGEIGLGVGANEILGFLGNGSSADIDYAGNPFGFNAIYGKYFLNANTAIRVRFAPEFSKYREFYNVAKSNLTPDPLRPMWVQDEAVTSRRDVMLGLGLEKRRGSSRFQGVYGAEVLVGVSGQNINYLYGNDMNAEFPNPARTNFGSYGPITGSRIITNNYSNQLNLGLRAFLGAEYFFAPKASIGCEFGYAFVYSDYGITESTYEYFDASANKVEKVYVKNNGYSGKYKSLDLGIDNLSGAINLFIYF